MIKLIIVEDELQMLEYLAKIVNWNELGFDLVGIFSNGLEAKEYIDTHPVNCILSDIELPIINGIELAKYCHNTNKDIKIIFISAYRSFEYAVDAIQYGVISYITKPIIYSKFIKALTDASSYFGTESYVPAENTLQYTQPVREVIDYIEKNFSKKITLTTAAHHVHLNASYLSRIFKGETGKNFSDYLNDYRIMKSAELLQTTDYPASSIAMDVGLFDVHCFYKLFKKKMGVTAHDYRKEHKIER